MLAGDSKTDVFSQAKGILDYFDLDISFEPVDSCPSWSEENICAKVMSSGQDLGLIAKVNGEILRSLGIKKHIAVAELNFGELFKLSSGLEKKYQEIPKYPPLIRDLAFVVGRKILYNDIKKEIEGFDKLIKEVKLFDVYEGSKLGKDKKNLAFQITYRADDRTLTGEEVDRLQQRLVKKMKDKFGAQVRDF